MTVESQLFGKLHIHVTEFNQLEPHGQVMENVGRRAKRTGFWCCLCFLLILVWGGVLGGRAMTSLDEASADQATFAIAPPPVSLAPPPPP